MKKILTITTFLLAVFLCAQSQVTPKFLDSALKVRDNQIIALQSQVSDLRLVNSDLIKRILKEEGNNRFIDKKSFPGYMIGDTAYFNPLPAPVDLSPLASRVTSLENVNVESRVAVVEAWKITADQTISALQGWKGTSDPIITTLQETVKKIPKTATSKSVTTTTTIIQ